MTLRPTSWLPLATLAVLVVTTLWLNRLVQPPPERASGNLRHDPDTFVEQFNARKLGEDGRVLYTLAAKKMVHYPDDDSAQLETLTLRAFEPRQPPMTVTADHGRLEEGGDRVWIEGHVVLVREADAQMEPARVTTDRMLVLPDEGRAISTTQVTMQTPSGHAVAAGLELDNKTRTLKLDRVRATYQPAPR